MKYLKFPSVTPMAGMNKLVSQEIGQQKLLETETYVVESESATNKILKQ